MIDAVRLMIRRWSICDISTEIESSLGINSTAIYSILHDHLKLRKSFRTMDTTFALSMIKNDFEFNSVANHWNDSNKDDLGVFLTSLLVMDHSFIIMILKPNSGQKCGCQKMILVRQKFEETKVLGNEWSQFSSWSPAWSSQLHWNLVPQSVHDHMSRTACLVVFDAVAQRREKTGLRGLILHDDNARSHRAWMTIEYLAENRVKSYQNPSYLPDLSLCNFFLFQKLKNKLREIQFNNDEEMLEALDHAIGCLTKEDFQNCFSDWFSRMQKCIDVGREYFEKINWHWYLNIFCKSWRKNFPSAPCTYLLKHKLLGHLAHASHSKNSPYKPSLAVYRI